MIAYFKSSLAIIIGFCVIHTPKAFALPEVVVEI